MEKEYFENFRQAIIIEYASEKVKAGAWTESEALDKSKDSNAIGNESELESSRAPLSSVPRVWTKRLLLAHNDKHDKATRNTAEDE